MKTPTYKDWFDTANIDELEAECIELYECEQGREPNMDEIDEHINNEYEVYISDLECNAYEKYKDERMDNE